MSEWWEANGQEILESILNGKREDIKICPHCNKIYHIELDMWVNYNDDFRPEINEMLSSKSCPRHHLQELKEMVIYLQGRGVKDDYLMRIVEERETMEMEEKIRLAERLVA